MRKIVVFGLVGALLLGAVATAMAADGTLVARMITAYYGNISVKVNGDVVKADAEPFIVEGRTYVPLRSVGEALGMDVAWDQDNQQVVIAGKVVAKDAAFTPHKTPVIGQFGGTFGATFTGIVANTSNKTAHQVSVTCSTTDKDGAMVVSGSKLVAEQLEPMASLAFQFDSVGDHKEPPTAVKCSAAAQSLK